MAYSHDTSNFINDYRGLMLLYFYRENYNAYNGNTQLCDIHYFILKGDKKLWQRNLSISNSSTRI